MSDLNAIKRQWEQDIARHDAARKALQEKRAPLAAKLEAFNAAKPKNLWGKLSHAFNKVTGMAIVSHKVHKLERKIEDRNTAIFDAAHEAYRGLGETALAALPNGDTFRRDYAGLTQSLQMLSNTQAEVRRAISKCEQASGMETIDAFSNNKGISLMSYMETSDASNAIQSAKRSLDKLQRELQSVPRLHDNISDGLRFDNNIGLALDMIGGMDGMFMSLSNKRDLDRAANQLRSVSQDLGRIGDALDSSRDQILNLSISLARKYDGGIEALANDLAPHLPRAIAQGMAPKQGKKFSL